MREPSEQYLRNKAERCINTAFRTLWFDDMEMRDILYDSYMLSIDAMNNYVRHTSVDMHEYYFDGLRKVLRQLPYVHNFHRHQR